MCILIGANFLFYAHLTIWTILRIKYGYVMVIYLLGYVNRLVPALLLIFSVRLVNRQIKKLNNREIMAKETLIRAHTYTFVICLLVSLALKITTYAAYL